MPTLRNAVVALTLLAGTPTFAAFLTPLTSYEASETDLSVTAAAGDSGLSLAIVTGGVDGAPPATDGQRLLRLTISNEFDRKVEFRHHWSNSTYDLVGHEALLADVYVANAGAVPGVVGIWSANWSPPDAWHPASNIPNAPGSWQTVTIDVSQNAQAGLDSIWAFVLEDLADETGVVYVDNLRFRAAGELPTATGIAANGRPDRNEVFWKPTVVGGLEGYHVYRASFLDGPYSRVTPSPITVPQYVDWHNEDNPVLFYYVTAVVAGNESAPSETVRATYNGMTDDQMLDMVQAATFTYFWDNAHPHNGMAREGIGTGHPADTVTTGGTGMGLMTIVVGAERGFVTRAAAAQRIRRIVRFLDGIDPDDPELPSGVQRYHGAWSHHLNGRTGATIAFAGPMDNGGDLVETAFLVQGLLTVRQYFDDPLDPVETEIRSRVSAMWESVEWNWYRRFPGSPVLYWHWSPDFDWALDLQIRGYNESRVVYLLAIASPTHPMPGSSYALGWAGLSSYTNGNTYFGYPLAVGPPLGGPLFFTHYSSLGFDPRYKRDAFANYFENARNTTLVNRAHCIMNPNDHVGYSPLVWGLTASTNPWGYAAHAPTNDNGTITPTAALSAMPYTPTESLAALRYLFDQYGEVIFGGAGFRDAFHLGENWVAPGHLAIDQGTIVPMIENYRSGLCWRLFMSNSEIRTMLPQIGMFFEVDYDLDDDVDVVDATVFVGCISAPDDATVPAGCTDLQFDDSDLDNDADVDLRDIAAFQRLFGL